ncbi:hypothetical protein CAOG_01367 [Capsaspora owczarzaki ATCC 30864]|uniref:Uncharacterized protein n=1 Tax=Capsaspora owczarzaki (strain ATCC 30864) TaxID=595528 RepID=A0A0D2VJ09_CAPO3|nr:hypothetical protein CAOG_01367 [Capsaspora owczarzaki ATCC 30864]KJE89977.1 hypothetical protein CAOG_001367 [Capsaspora owczarzaki ATCC 30864]|eukprot:XP_004349887.1 hypothetical protein CAOG_01367 [Capsaspora owczarzaki ATCC 30864]
MADIDDFEVPRGALRIKGGAIGGVKKAKSKKPAPSESTNTQAQGVVSSVLAELAEGSTPDDAASSTQAAPKADLRTPAQKKADALRERREAERILKQASVSHKDRIAEFNKKLDEQSEHYDVPKISWTNFAPTPQPLPLLAAPRLPSTYPYGSSVTRGGRPGGPTAATSRRRFAGAPVLQVARMGD